MKVLVLNCGSSSIKYQVIEMKCHTEHVLLGKGIVERIGQSEGILTHKPTDKEPLKITKSIPDHTSGITLILEALTDAKHGVLSSIDEITAVGHRVAHGGEFFKDSAIIDEAVKERIRSCFELAPLHNPANYQGITAMEAILPGTPQVAVFDTSFHQTIPAKHFMYGLPYKYYTDYRIRVYGFHGTSHQFVAKKACKMVGLELEKSKIITCHIGNGASITAIENGKSVETSMGFTPADGLLMGTRTGTIDPGALIYIAERENLSFDQLSDLINKESGLLGITGFASDMRDIHTAIAEGNDRAKLALDMLVARLKKYVGGYIALMGGVDMIVFTGGIGENDYDVREGVCTGMEYLGIEFDLKANDKLRSQDRVLSLPTSKVKVVVAMTNEELVIASDTFRLLADCAK